MGGVEGRCDLRGDRHRALGGESSDALEQLTQVATLDEPHRDVESPIRLPGRVDRDDVRVLERSCEPRLAQEALAEPFVAHELRPEDLERDAPLEHYVLGEIDRTRRAGSEKLEHSKTAELGSGRNVRAHALVISSPRPMFTRRAT